MFTAQADGTAQNGEAMDAIHGIALQEQCRQQMIWQNYAQVYGTALPLMALNAHTGTAHYGQMPRQQQLITFV